MVRVKVFVSHPIPYFVALWRELAKFESIDLTVIFFSKEGVSPSFNSQFNQVMSWDLNLLSGYSYRFVDDVPHAQIKSTGLGSADQYIDPTLTDVVMIHGYSDLYARQAVRVARKRGIKTYMRGPVCGKTKLGRGFLKKVIRDLYLRFFFLNKFDGVFYIGKSSYTELRRLGVDDARLHYSPYTVDTDNFSQQHLSAEDRILVRSQLGIAQGAIVILMVGVFSKRKNHDVVLRSLIPFVGSNVFHLVFVGEGPNKNDIVKKARDFGLDFVSFVGFVNQSKLGQYYSAADIFVFPSFYDSWGLVLNEAVMFGLPVVVSKNVASSDDLVIGGGNGFVFDPDDSSALTEALAKLRCPDRRKRMGALSSSIARGYRTELAAQSIARILNGL